MYDNKNRRENGTTITVEAVNLVLSDFVLSEF